MIGGRCWRQALIVVFLVMAPASGGPLRFLMMSNNHKKQQQQQQQQKPEQKQQQTQQTQQNQQPEVQQQADLEQQQPDDVSEPLIQQDAHVQEAQKQCVDPTAHGEEIESLKAQHQEALAECAKTQDEAKRAVELKEDLVDQIAKLQSQSSKELSQAQQKLADAQTALEEKQKEFDAMKSKLEDSIKVKEALTERRLRETENLWKEELEILKTTSKVQMKNAELEADDKCQETVKQRLESVAAASSTAGSEDDNSNKQQAKLLNIERVKVKVLEEQNASLVAQHKEIQQLMDQLKLQFDAKLKDKEEQLQTECANTMQEKIEEASRDSIAAIRKDSEIQLAKAMELCDEETDRKLLDQKALEEKTASERLAKERAALEEEKSTKLAALSEANTKSETVLKEQMVTLQATIDELKQSLVDQKEAAKETAEKVKEEHAAALGAVKDTVAQLKQDMVDLKSQHAVELEATKETTTANVAAPLDKKIAELQKDLKASEQGMLLVKKGLQKDLTSTQKLLDKEVLNSQRLNASVAHLTRKLDQSQSDVQYWEKMFVRRSYFNATHFQEDAFGVVGHAAAATGRQLQVWWQHAHQWWMQHVGDPVEKALKPISEPLGRAYRQYVQKHVAVAWGAMNKHAKQVGDSVSAFHNSLHEHLAAWFQRGADVIRRNCPKIHKLAKANQWPKSFVHTTIDPVCEQPESALRQWLTTGALVLAVIFRHPLWQLLLMCFRFLVRVLVWMAGLPIQLLASGKQTKQPQQVLDPNKKKPDPDEKTPELRDEGTNNNNGKSQPAANNNGKKQPISNKKS